MPRSKKAQPQKTAQVDPSPGTSEENEPATPEAAPASAPAPVPAKQYRTAHKDIANYKFTAEQVKVLVEFIQANHCLYMKTHRGYANNKEKLTLWHQCAALFPGATYLQCRKYFEQKRTAYGKIEAAEMKSGSDVKPRTPREQEIMETWAFFKGHIAHASHTSSQRFSSGHESSSSSTDVSGLSAASIQRRKQLKKRRSEPSAATDETSPPAASPTVPAAAAAAGASEAIINTTQILGSLLEAQRESRAESSEADDFGRMVARSMKKLKQNQFHRCCIEIHQVIAKYQDAAEAPQAAPPQQQQQLLPQQLPPQQQQQLLPQKLPPQHQQLLSQQLPHQQPPATPQWADKFSTPTRAATPGPWMRDLLSPYTGPSTSGYQTPSTSGYQTPFVSYPQTTSTPASATQSAGPSTSTPASITVSSPQKTFLHAVTCIDRSLVAPLGNPISPLHTPDRPDLKRIAEEERLQNL